MTPKRIPETPDGFYYVVLPTTLSLAVLMITQTHTLPSRARPRETEEGEEEAIDEHRGGCDGAGSR